MRVDFEREELGQSWWGGIGVAEVPDEEQQQAESEVDEADEFGIEPALGPRADGRRRYDDEDEEDDYALDDDYEDDEDYDEDYDDDLDEDFDEDEDLDDDLDEDTDEDV